MDPVPVNYKSLSARRAWIEICHTNGECGPRPVALRKESVDRNRIGGARQMAVYVALRKESVDRNTSIDNLTQGVFVALRKESVDRNLCVVSLNYKEVRRSPQGERG